LHREDAAAYAAKEKPAVIPALAEATTAQGHAVAHVTANKQKIEYE
jgi:hypothetical protein